MTAIENPTARPVVVPQGAEKERLLAAVSGIEDEIRRHIPRMDRERKLPPELADALASAGFFRMLVPVAAGGLEMEPLAAANVVEALAQIDGSTGWCVMIGAQWQWYVAALPERGQERIFSQPNLKVAGALKPGGQAVKVDGGYRVSGRWSFASGCTYADWLAGSCLIDDGTEAAPGAMPSLCVVYVPAGEAAILDNWNTPGLRGTGSNDFVLNDVFVPAECTTPFPDLGPAEHPGPLYRAGYQNLVYVLQAAQALGVARGAFDSFVTLAAEKVRWVSTSSLVDDAVVRTQVADAEVLIQSARAWLHRATGDAWRTLLEGGEPDAGQRLQVRMAITHAIRASLEAASLLHAASGTAALGEDHPLQRQWQDLRTGAAHVQATPKILEQAGGLLMGADVPVAAALF